MNEGSGDRAGSAEPAEVSREHRNRKWLTKDQVIERVLLSLPGVVEKSGRDSKAMLKSRTLTGHDILFRSLLINPSLQAGDF